MVWKVLLPYYECAPQECTDVRTPHWGCLCTQDYINEHGDGMCITQECTDLDTHMKIVYVVLIIMV